MLGWWPRQGSDRSLFEAPGRVCERPCNVEYRRTRLNSGAGGRECNLIHNYCMPTLCLALVGVGVTKTDVPSASWHCVCQRWGAGSSQKGEENKANSRTINGTQEGSRVSPSSAFPFSLRRIDETRMPPNTSSWRSPITLIRWDQVCTLWDRCQHLREPQERRSCGIWAASWIGCPRQFLRGNSNTTEAQGGHDQAQLIYFIFLVKSLF